LIYRATIGLQIAEALTQISYKLDHPIEQLICLAAAQIKLGNCQISLKFLHILLGGALDCQPIYVMAVRASTNC
jgi:hypothetical protein